MIWQQFKPTLCATVPYSGIEGACRRDGEPVPYSATRRDDVGIVPYNSEFTGGAGYELPKSLIWMQFKPPLRALLPYVTDH